VVATIIKSDLAALNVNLSVQSLAWPTQWAKGKSSNPAQRQDIFLKYWWPDYPDPYSWFSNLLQTESPRGRAAAWITPSGSARCSASPCRCSGWR
jgi:peptide/nickel transport system substrate-binding protein